jgi:hypothetical protein
LFLPVDELIQNAPMWTTDISDSDLITEEKADFVLAEAKQQLAATVQDAEGLTQTGIYLLGGLLTVTSGLVGVMSTLFAGALPLAAQKWGTILPLLVTAIYLASDAAMIMWSALSTKGLDHSGNAPRNLATQEYFQLDLRLIKFAEAVGYQDRIENNHRRNEAIGARINIGIKGACLAPFIYLAVLAAARLTLPC